MAQATSAVNARTRTVSVLSPLGGSGRARSSGSRSFPGSTDGDAAELNEGTEGGDASGTETGVLSTMCTNPNGLEASNGSARGVAFDSRNLKGFPSEGPVDGSFAGSSEGLPSPRSLASRRDAGYLFESDFQ